MSNIYPTKLLITTPSSALLGNSLLKNIFPRFPKRKIAVFVLKYVKFCFNSIAKEAFHDSSDIGRTIPIVPRIEIPPIIPNFAFIVFLAASSPKGTLISTSIPFPSGRNSSTILVNIFIGVGLIADFPISTGSPTFVTFPTPFPPKILILLSFLKLTFETISKPCVASGSSPPSFTTVAIA